jgi:hypothetical protein
MRGKNNVRLLHADALVTFIMLGIISVGQPCSAIFIEANPHGRGKSTLMLEGMVASTDLRNVTETTLMGKVTEMLQEMKERSLFLQGEASAQHAEVQRVCENTTSVKQGELSDLQVQVEGLQAEIGELELQTRELEAEIVQHGLELNQSSVSLETAHSERSESASAITTEVEEYTSAIVSLERALEILQQQSQSEGGLGFLATSSSKRLVGKTLLADLAAKEAMAAASRALRMRRYTPDTGGLAKDEHLFDDFADLDTATTRYASRASSITELLSGLKESFAKERDVLLEKEKAQRSAFEAEQSSLERAIESNRESRDVKRSLLSEKRVELIEKQQALNQSSLNLNSTSAFLQQVQHACDERNRAFEEVHVMRAQEVEALTKAIEIVTGDMTPHTSKVALQLLSVAGEGFNSSHNRSDGGSSRLVAAGERGRKLLGFLRVQAAKLGSDSMGRLVGCVAGELAKRKVADGKATTKALEDPLEKVRGMIRELILQLQASATEEAGNKAWCDSQVAENEDVQKGAQASIAKHTAKMEQLDGERQKLEMELEQLNSTLNKSSSERESLVNDRANESAANLAAITDAEEAARLADTAILLLQEYFANVSKASPSQASLVGVRALHSAQSVGSYANESLPDILSRKPGASEVPLSAQGGGVLAMLEVIRDEYKSLASKTQAQEAEAVQLHQQVILDLDVMVTSASADQRFKTEEVARLEEELATARSNLNASSTELEDALAAYEDLKPPCLNTETYEERKAKRETEISALNEAYDMVEEYSTQFSQSSITALVQRGGGVSGSDPSSEVTQVAQLLSEIRVEVVNDMTEDTQVYNEIVNWCTDTIALKQSAIEDAQQRESDLITEIESHAQEKAKLEAQIAHSEKELEADANSLDQSDDLRAHALDSFRKSESELLESIQALQNALIVLSKHHDANATSERDYLAEQEQLEQEKLGLNLSSGGRESLTAVAVAASVRRALKALPGGADAGLAMMSAQQREVLEEFLSRPQALLLTGKVKMHSIVGNTNADTGLRSVASVDGDMIYGILQQLLETFKTDLSAARAAEAQAVSDHGELGSSKLAQVNALKATLATKREQLVHYTTAGAEAKEDLSYNRAARQADIKYLQDVQLQCAEHDREFSTRNSTRHEEVAALDEAIGILSPTTASPTATLVAFVRGNNSNTKLRLAGVPSGRIFRRKRLQGGTLPNSSVSASAGSRIGAAISSSSMSQSSRRILPGRRALAASNFSSEPAVFAAKRAALATTAVRVAVAGHSFTPPLATRYASARVLATLARRASMGIAQVRFGPLTAEALSGVVSRIEELRKALREEGAMEVRMHETCISENNSAREQLERRLSDEAMQNLTLQRLNGTLDSTATEITRLEREITALNESINLSQVQRSEEHSEFRKTIETEEAHQAKLQQAVETLKVVYGGDISLIVKTRRADNETTPAPAPLPERTQSRVNTTAYKARTLDTAYSKPLEKHEGSVGIVHILEMLIEKSEDLVESLVRAEEADRDQLGLNLEDVRRAMEEKDRQVIAMRETYANAEAQRQEVNASRISNRDEQSEIKVFFAMVENKCNALLANFASNQDARSLELENLLHARNMLEGMVSSSGIPAV